MHDPTPPAARGARRQWLVALNDPHARKTTGRLVRANAADDPRDEARCCLGHACMALGASRTGDAVEPEGYELHRFTLPARIAKRLDITAEGAFTEPMHVWRGPEGLAACPAKPAPPDHVDAVRVDNLSELNDSRLDPSPREIGQFLETGFHLLAHYPDDPTHRNEDENADPSPPPAPRDGTP